MVEAEEGKAAGIERREGRRKERKGEREGRRKGRKRRVEGKRREERRWGGR